MNRVIVFVNLYYKFNQYTAFNTNALFLGAKKRTRALYPAPQKNCRYKPEIHPIPGRSAIANGC